MIENFKKIIEENLEKYFDKALENKDFELFFDVIKSMKYTTCLGGKRIRGVFCLETARIFSPTKDFAPAIPTACAIEMLHSQSLIHDDLPCMDNDDLRRGKPSNHKVFGEAIATLAGDALITFGPQIIIENSNNVPKERILEVIKEYSIAAGAFGIVGGQTADIEAENKKITLEHLQAIHKFKTGALFKFALISGAIISGADEKSILALKKFGDTFGLAFQIRDDILDVVSTKEELGKTTGKDENSNKSTYVTLLGLEEAREKLNSAINECYDILKENCINSNVLEEITSMLNRGVN